MAPENEAPKIPSFKPKAQEEEKKGAGLFPTLGKPGGPASLSPGKTGLGFPSLAKEGGGGLKVRGLPGGATVLERLKRLRKKDLAFIAAGLSVLMMAPVAEHFLMNPEAEGGTLTQGFSTPGDNALFPDGKTVYESGTGGLSPGSLYGGGSDVITPLNVRDPSALVMGPGATQKPAAAVTAPETPQAQSGGGWKDALAQAATAGTKTAVSKAAKLPMPSVKMSGALRGLSATGGGGSGGGLSLAAPSTANAPNHAKDSNSLARVTASPGYRGAARQSRESGSGMESLKAAADRQGDIFNKGHSASNSLDTAARENIPSGGGSGSGEGSPGAGGGDKGPGGNGDHDKRNISVGESLELMRQKLEMQKAIDLKWKKREWNELGRQQEIQKMLIASGGKLFEKAFIEPVGGAIGQMFSSIMPQAASGPAGFICLDAAGNTIKEVPKSKVKDVGSNYISYVVDVGKDGTLQKIDCAKVVPYGGAKVDGGGGQQNPDQSPQSQERAGNQSQIKQALQTCVKEGKTDRPFCIALDKLDKAMDQVRAMERKDREARSNLDDAWAKMDKAVAALEGGRDPLGQANALLGVNQEGKVAEGSMLAAGQQAEAKLKQASSSQDQATQAALYKEAGEAVDAGAKNALAKVDPQLENVRKAFTEARSNNDYAIGSVEKAVQSWREGMDASKQATGLIGQAKAQLNAVSLAQEQPALTKNIGTVESDWKQFDGLLTQVGGKRADQGRADGKENGSLDYKADQVTQSIEKVWDGMQKAHEAVGTAEAGPKAAAGKLADMSDWKGEIQSAYTAVSQEDPALQTASTNALNNNIKPVLAGIEGARKKVTNKAP